MTNLSWLPKADDWRARLRTLTEDPAKFWQNATRLANHDLDFVMTNQIDNLTRTSESDRSASAVRLAVLSSSTTAHLLPGLRVAGLRRNIRVEVIAGRYGQYWQDLIDGDSSINLFKPTAVLFSFDPYHLTAGVRSDARTEDTAAAFERVKKHIRDCWQLAHDRFGSGCQILQQTAIPVHTPLLGSNEHRLVGSKAAFVSRLNAALRPMADEVSVDIVALDDRALVDGITNWHNPALWHRAKQDVSPVAGPLYGELVIRLVSAHFGRSAKCLVLDLDNTLWGGVVGDDGLQGIVLGQGSAPGEAFVEFQRYVLELSRRGVILAVCSKNSEANATEPFDKHPEMILRRSDIACFAANWGDKVSNLRSIADQLNIGLDSLVFVDDNPFERNLVRMQLPAVGVPEVGDDPSNFARIIGSGGYFEALVVTDDDRKRSSQYQGNILRESLRTTTSDLSTYLQSLKMQLLWRHFDQIGLNRIVQLINKTNQFNLTTRRYTESDILAVINGERMFGLQLRLLDCFGDNGVIGIVIGKVDDALNCVIDTWLMSCRVLGRQVEQAILNVVVDQAHLLGARCLIGDYIPSAKNGMVVDHYSKLGFVAEVEQQQNGTTRWKLTLSSFTPLAVPMAILED